MDDRIRDKVVSWFNFHDSSLTGLELKALEINENCVLKVNLTDLSNQCFDFVLSVSSGDEKLTVLSDHEELREFIIDVIEAFGDSLNTQQIITSVLDFCRDYDKTKPFRASQRQQDPDYYDDVSEYSASDDSDSDEVEYEDIPDFTPQLGHQESYTAVESGELPVMQEAMVSRVGGQLNISPFDAAILLVHLGWDEQEVLSSYRQDPAGLCGAAGIRLPVLPGLPLSEDMPAEPEAKADTAGGEEDEFECPICLDDVSLSATFAMECSHRFCRPCWEQHLETALKNGASCLLCTCPDFKCSSTIPESVFKALLPSAQYEKYRTLMSASFVTKNGNVVRSECDLQQCREQQVLIFRGRHTHACAHTRSLALTRTRTCSPAHVAGL
jgi:hypothetical protein